MTHFVVKVMQLYLGPKIQQIIILVGVSFYRCSCHGKIQNLEICIINSNLHKYLEKALLFWLKSKFYEL